MNKFAMSEFNVCDNGVHKKFWMLSSMKLVDALESINKQYPGKRVKWVSKTTLHQQEKTLT